MHCMVTKYDKEVIIDSIYFINSNHTLSVRCIQLKIKNKNYLNSSTLTLHVWGNGKNPIYAFIRFIYFALSTELPICFYFVPRYQHHNQHKSAPVCCGTGVRARLTVCLLPSLLGLSCHPCPHLSQISLTILLFSVMWFPRLYIHYCSQWLFLQAQHIPINR